MNNRGWDIEYMNGHSQNVAYLVSYEDSFFELNVYSVATMKGEKNIHNKWHTIITSRSVLDK